MYFHDVCYTDDREVKVHPSHCPSVTSGHTGKARTGPRKVTGVYGNVTACLFKKW